MDKPTFNIMIFSSLQDCERRTNPVSIIQVSTLEEFDEVISDHKADYLVYVDNATGMILDGTECRVVLEKQASERQDPEPEIDVNDYDSDSSSRGYWWQEPVPRYTTTDEFPFITFVEDLLSLSWSFMRIVLVATLAIWLLMTISSSGSTIELFGWCILGGICIVGGFLLTGVTYVDPFPSLGYSDDELREMPLHLSWKIEKDYAEAKRIYEEEQARKKESRIFDWYRSLVRNGKIFEEEHARKPGPTATIDIMIFSSWEDSEHGTNPVSIIHISTIEEFNKVISDHKADYLLFVDIATNMILSGEDCLVMLQRECGYRERYYPNHPDYIAPKPKPTPTPETNEESKFFNFTWEGGLKTLTLMVLLVVIFLFGDSIRGQGLPTQGLTQDVFIAAILIVILLVAALFVKNADDEHERLRYEAWVEEARKEYKEEVER